MNMVTVPNDYIMEEMSHISNANQEELIILLKLIRLLWVVHKRAYEH